MYITLGIALGNQFMVALKLPPKLEGPKDSSVRVIFRIVRVISL